MQIEFSDEEEEPMSLPKVEGDLPSLAFPLPEVLCNSSLSEHILHALSSRVFAPSKL